MSSKKNKVKKQSDKALKTSHNDYYDLHRGAVEDLVTADKDNTPKYSAEELNRYRSRRGIKLGSTAKALIVKWWSAAAVCFFFLWGLGAYLRDELDQLVVLGLALGIVTDLLINNILRFLADADGGYDNFMMFPGKSYKTFPLNIVYAFLVLFMVYTLYGVINGTIVRITGATDTVPLGVEPVLFGLFYMGFDMMFICMKHLMHRIIRDARSGR